MFKTGKQWPSKGTSRKQVRNKRMARYLRYTFLVHFCAILSAKQIEMIKFTFYREREHSTPCEFFFPFLNMKAIAINNLLDDLEHAGIFADQRNLNSLPSNVSLLIGLCPLASCNVSWFFSPKTPQLQLGKRRTIIYYLFLFQMKILVASIV